MYNDFRTVTGLSTAPRHRPAVDFARIGFLHDFLRVPYAAGSAFAAQILHAEFRRRGHDVTLIGPRDPDIRPDELPEKLVAFPGIPVRSQPGFFLPMPERAPLRALAEQDFDIIVGQTASAFMEAGVWLRNTRRIPLLCVNTALLSSVYDAMLPEALHGNPLVQGVCKGYLVPLVEQFSVHVYNQSDGLVVLSGGVANYWRDLGVRVPIHVIPRSIDPRVSSGSAGPDPFDPRAERGERLLVLCRHVREKGLAKIIDVFASRIAPHSPNATLTMVGDGADHEAFKARAERLGVGHKVFFPGEIPVSQVRPWYEHADVFVYASLSETYGQVVSEAMWCGLPVVALDDGAGVSQQIRSGHDGILVAPNTDRTDELFGASILELLQHPERRRRFAEAAQRTAADRIDPDRCVKSYYTAFEQARRHRALCSVEVGRWKEVRPLARWATAHGLAGVLGSLRPKAASSSEAPRQPSWSDPTLSHPAPAARQPGGAAA